MNGFWPKVKNLRRKYILDQIDACRHALRLERFGSQAFNDTLTEEARLQYELFHLNDDEKMKSFY